MPELKFETGLVNYNIDTLKTTLNNTLEAVKQIFTGITEFLSGVFTGNWDLAWQGVKNIFKGVWNGIISIIEGAVNIGINAINSLIGGFNKILSLGDKVAEAIFGTTVRVPTIGRITLPRLATGAVIPPNREFMAVLGDQTSGNNIEAPESLIRKIVREESGGMNTELLQAKEIAAIRKENTMICYGILACLKGLKEQGCNGPVTEALNKLEKYLNEKAHEGDTA